MIWIDGTANLGAINTREKIVDLVAKIADVGFNTIVLDVKPIVGRTLYPSDLTDQMTSWKGQTLPQGFDPVRIFRNETLKHNLSLLVSMNAFSEGHLYAKRDENLPNSQFGKAGWGYEHPELQSVLYVKQKEGAEFRIASDQQDQIPLMMNPVHPKVQTRVLSFVKEIMTRYKPDGLLFDDRFRFHGLDGDFSKTSQSAFESYTHQKVSWPSDVYTWVQKSSKIGIKPGKFFDAWLAWRAQILADFAIQVKKEIKSIKPQAIFGIYAGSWYGDYAKYGSNYASSGLQAGFPFLTRAYKMGGFANSLDLLITGCYYKLPTMIDAMEQATSPGVTIEAAGDISNRVARDQCWVYAGIQAIDFKGDTELFARSLQAAAATTQGVMVFDLSHNIDDYWPVFKRAFAHKLDAPHSHPEYLKTSRNTRKLLDDSGLKDRPFPILEGAPGTGF